MGCTASVPENKAPPPRQVMVQKVTEDKKEKSHRSPSSSEKARRISNRRKPSSRKTTKRSGGESTTRSRSEEGSVGHTSGRDVGMEREITTKTDRDVAGDVAPSPETLGYEDTSPPRRFDEESEQHYYSGPLFRDQDSRLEKLVTSKRRQNSGNSSGLDSWAGLTLDDSVQSIGDVLKPELVDVELYEAMLDMACHNATTNKSNASVTERTAELSDHHSLGYNSCSIADESLYLEEDELPNSDKDEEQSKVEIQAPTPIEF